MARLQPALRLAAVSVVSACAPAVPQEPEILDPAAIERAKELHDIPRPWTVSKMLRQFQKANSVREKELILRVLAASRDPRAAVLLGETLPDEKLELRVAAAEGLVDHFLDAVPMGGTESTFFAAEAWWHAHERGLRTEAARLARQWPGD